MKAREPRNMPDLAVHQVEVVGIELPVVEQLAATCTSVIVLADAADCHDQFLG